VCAAPCAVRSLREGGADEVHKFAVNLVSSILKEVYSRRGLAFNGRISFSKLADAEVIDEDTAVYLTTLYMAVEGLLEELEEAEDLGDKNAAHNVMHEIDTELQRLTSTFRSIFSRDTG